MSADRHRFLSFLICPLLAMSLPFLAVSCGGINKNNFSEGLRAMTGKGGTHEERDILKEIEPTARDMGTYEPRPSWETGLEADAADLIEFLTPDRVLVGTVQLDPMLANPHFGPVILLDASSGREVWRSPRSSSEGSLFSLLTGSPSLLLQDDSRLNLRLISLDPATGAAAWEKQFAKPASALALPGENFVLVALQGGEGTRLTALALRDGAEAWTSTLPAAGGKGDSAPVLMPAGDRILVVGSTLTMVRVKDGSRVWQAPNPAGEAETLSLILKSGVLLRSGSLVWMVGLKDGRTMWGPLDLGSEISALTVDSEKQGRAFAVLRGGASTGLDSVFALDLSRGTRKWGRSLDSRVLSGLLLLNEKVLFTTASRLEALRAGSGKTLYRTALPKGIAGLSSQELPDNLGVHGRKIILSREMRGAAAFDPASGKLAWSQPVRLMEQAEFWYVTREKALYNASGMSSQYGKVAEADRIWWSNFLYSSDQYWRTQDVGPSSPSSLPGGLSTSRWQANQAFINSMFALSAAVDRGLKQGALNALVQRKRLELENSVATHLHSIRGGYWMRPFHRRGTGVTLVDLETGRRADFEFSAPNYGMDKYGVVMPCFAVDPTGRRLVTVGISLDTERWQRYVKFRYGMPYPSVMAYDLSGLRFTSVQWNNGNLPVKADSGKLEDVRRLLKAGAWVDSRDASGNTALMNASYQGHDDVVKLLLEKGASVNLRVPGSAVGTAMERAAANGHVSTVGLLLKAGADPDEGMRAAAARGQEGVLALFRQDGFRTPAASLKDAAIFGDVEAVRGFLDAGEEVDSRTGTSGDTPLMLAARQGHVDAVRLLLDRGARINSQQKSGQKETALMMAAGAGTVPVVSLLLDRGAGVNVMDADKLTALHHAAEGGNVKVTELLLNAGADLKARSGIYRTTPLLSAAGEGKADVAGLLLKRGADPDYRNKDGQSALYKAAYSGNLELAKVLLSGGASVDLPDKYGDTPLFTAATQGHLQVLRALLKSGADVNHQNRSGKTALGEVNSFYGGKGAVKEDIIRALKSAGGT